MSSVADDVDGAELMGLELWDLADITPYENNPLDHEAEQITALKESIEKFGFKNPLIINPEGTIVSGHARYEAIEQLRAGGLDATIAYHEDEGNEEVVRNLALIREGKVQVLVTDDLTDEERDEFRIADNKVFEHSSWDNDSLTFELRELESAVGFDKDEVDDMVDTSRGKIDYEPGEVEDTKKRLEKHYEELSEAKRKRKAALPCPNCDGTLFIDKPELKRALKRAEEQAEDGEGIGEPVE